MITSVCGQATTPAVQGPIDKGLDKLPPRQTPATRAPNHTDLTPESQTSTPASFCEQTYLPHILTSDESHMLHLWQSSLTAPSMPDPVSISINVIAFLLLSLYLWMPSVYRYLLAGLWDDALRINGNGDTAIGAHRPGIDTMRCLVDSEESCDKYLAWLVRTWNVMSLLSMAVIGYVRNSYCI
jgi:hypothetical protein